MANVMRDSLTYQAVLEEGRAEEAHRILRRLGERRFGPPSATILDRLHGLDDIERIECATVHLLDVTSWENVLADLRIASPSNCS